MPFVVIRHGELFKKERPVSVQGLFTEEQWSTVHDACQAARDESACALACVTCCYIWSCCCKDQAEFNMMCTAGNLSQKLQQVNSIVFCNKPVMQVRHGAVVCQSDYLIGNEGLQMAVASSADVEVSIGGFDQVEYQPVSQQSEALPDAPQPSAIRKMDVIVPPGAPPGSVLSVQDPYGQIVQVTVPEGVTAGMKLEFQY